MKMFIVAMMLVVSMMVNVGCITSGGGEKKSASTIGAMAAAIWVAYDSPTDAQKSNVVSALEFIRGQEALHQKAGGTFVYPLIQEWAVKNVPEKDRPLVTLGALVLLTDLDQMFESNPTWTTIPVDMGEYADLFINGAESILRQPMAKSGAVLNRRLAGK